MARKQPMIRMQWVLLGCLMTTALGRHDKYLAFPCVRGRSRETESHATETGRRSHQFSEQWSEKTQSKKPIEKPSRTFAERWPNSMEKALATFDLGTQETTTCVTRCKEKMIKESTMHLSIAKSSFAPGSSH